MRILLWFTKLMKGEPNVRKKSMHRAAWIIDESKCLSMREVIKLRRYSSQAKDEGLKGRRFSRIREWFMIELGLNSGLRVSEMASLQHKDLLIDHTRSSIIVLGKGNKKRAVWISSRFRQVCRSYFLYKKRFGYDSTDESYLLNNLKGTKISKRALQKDFKSMIRNARLPLHYHIHCLRHTYATFLLKVSNYNYRFVQKQLGHTSIRTTQVYAGSTRNRGEKSD